MGGTIWNETGAQLKSLVKSGTTDAPNVKTRSKNLYPVNYGFHICSKYKFVQDGTIGSTKGGDGSSKKDGAGVQHEHNFQVMEIGRISSRKNYHPSILGLRK